MKLYQIEIKALAREAFGVRRFSAALPCGNSLPLARRLIGGRKSGDKSPHSIAKKAAVPAALQKFRNSSHDVIRVAHRREAYRNLGGL